MRRQRLKKMFPVLAGGLLALAAVSPALAAEPGKSKWWERLSLGFFSEPETRSNSSFPAYEAVAGNRAANRLGLGGERFPLLPVYIFSPTVGGADLDHYSDNSQALFFYLGYDLTSRLNLRGTMGIAGSKNGGDDSHLLENTRRWGVDFAATYQLLDNLVYQAHLGYVSLDHGGTPAALPRLGGESLPRSAASLDGEPSSLYQIGSHIRMTF